MTRARFRITLPAVPTIRPPFIYPFARTRRGIGAAVVVGPLALLLAASLSAGVVGFLLIWGLGWLAVAIWADSWEGRSYPWFRFSARRNAFMPGLLREDPNAQFLTDRRGFLWRKRLWFIGTGVNPTEVQPERYARLAAEEATDPVIVVYAGPRQWWWFAERFYCESENYTAKDVKALALERERRKTRVLGRAHDLMAIGANGGLRPRDPIPEDVKRVVFRRDGGRCVNCGSNELIQFDHIIPYSMGGSSTPENLQVLCANCNREKSGSL